MMISVIVPIYKVEKYLQQCVDSILQQKYKNLEIILVDDGSPDHCPAICDTYAASDNRVKVIHKKNGGLIAARKSGVEIATGEYITFVDGDDWISPEMYQRVADRIEAYQPDCVISEFFFAYEDHQTESKQLLRQPYYTRKEMERELFPTMLYAGKWYQFGIFPNCWTKVFKADILRKHIFNVDDRIRLGEDIAFTYPCLMDCQHIAYIDEALYYYRQNPESMTAVYDKRLPSIYMIPYNAVKKSSEELGIDLTGQLPYYLLYLNNFLIRNEASKDNIADYAVQKAVLKDVLKNGMQLSGVQLTRLPLHVALLYIALKLRSVFLVKIYKLLMAKYIR